LIQGSSNNNREKISLVCFNLIIWQHNSSRFDSVAFQFTFPSVIFYFQYFFHFSLLSNNHFQNIYNTRQKHATFLRALRFLTPIPRPELRRTRRRCQLFLEFKLKSAFGIFIFVIATFMLPVECLHFTRNSCCFIAI
jgi:hypothetical protein